MSRRKVEINRKHITHEELEKLYKECMNGQIKIRYLAMLKFWEDKTSIEVAKILNVSDSTVREWLQRYNMFGPEGLMPIKPKGAECKLDENQLQQVYEIMQKSPREAGYNKSNWTMPLLKKWINREFGINYSVSGLYDLVHRIGFSIQRPKKQSKNADPVKQREFKDKLKKIIDEADEDTVILYEDEAIVTTEPTTTGKWALKGKQPVIPTDSKGTRKRRVIFGAANPVSGEVIYSTKETRNSENFESFLK